MKNLQSFDEFLNESYSAGQLGNYYTNWLYDDSCSTIYVQQCKTGISFKELEIRKINKSKVESIIKEISTKSDWSDIKSTLKSLKIQFEINVE